MGVLGNAGGSGSMNQGIVLPPGAPETPLEQQGWPQSWC